MPAPAKTGPGEQNLAGRRLGRYEVLTQIASGGMAGVYAGRAVGVAGFERLVAIKVLHPHLAYEEEFISMFLDEARLAARIRHPNVVATLDISDSDGDGYFIVMEYIEGDHFGGLLSKAARAGERLPTPVTARVVMDALSGLDAAHKLVDETGTPLELVHRDVSPHNVMVGKDGISRLTDFGVAKAQVRLSSTRAGQFKGKLSYMAPEQASTGIADQRSDLFSMGIILWEGLTGRRLFRAENNAATLNKILREPIPLASELFPELSPFDDVLRKALAREPEDRYQSAEEMLEGLEKAAQGAGGIATTRKVAKQVARWDGEKLEAEAARLRQAMDALGHTDLHEAQMPMPREGSVSRISGPKTTTAGPDEPTLAASPQAVAEEHAERQTKRRAGLVLALLICAGLAGALYLGLFQSSSSEPAEASPAQDEPAVRSANGAPGVQGDTSGGPGQLGTVTEAARPADEATPTEAAPTEAAPTEAAPTEASPTMAASDAESAGAGRRSGRRGRHREHRRPRADQGEPSTAAAEPPAMTAPAMPPASMMAAAPPDDLLANPYRR